MFSTVKKLSTLSIILCAINILAGIMWLVFIAASHDSFAEQFSMAAYLISASGVLLAASCALRSACQDFELENETYTRKLIDLKKRVDELEKRF